MDLPSLNLLTAVPEILARATHAPLLVGLDFDGTLVPFAARPEQVRLDAEGRRLLESVRDRQGLHVAIVSGRTLDDVVLRVGVEGIAYAGNHGAEIRLADGTKQVHTDDRMRALCIRVRDSLTDLVSDLAGVWVEDKGPVIALHYRQADGAARAHMWERLSSWRIARPVGLRERGGSEVTEFLPNSLPTKGDAVLAIARAVGIPTAWQLLYIGDDETDEEAFRALGPTALTAKVGSRDRLTTARYWVDGPAEVRVLLERLAAGPEARRPGEGAR